MSILRRTIHTYETTYEREDHLGNVTASLEVRIEYTFTPGVPARIMWDENDHPAEGPEIEIADILEQTWKHGLGKEAVYEWTKIQSQSLYETLSEWAIESLWDNLVEEAIEEEASLEEAAAELAYESRRELQES